MPRKPRRWRSSPRGISDQLRRSRAVVDFEAVWLEHVGAKEAELAAADEHEHLSRLVEPVHDDHETFVAGDVFVSQLGLHRADWRTT